MVTPSNGKNFLTDEDFPTSADFLTCLKEHSEALVLTIKGSKLQLHLADCGHFKGADDQEWVRNGTHKGVLLNRNVLTKEGLLQPGSEPADWVWKHLHRELTREDWCTNFCRQNWEKEVGSRGVMAI